jgi:hypothetical protein
MEGTRRHLARKKLRRKGKMEWASIRERLERL